MTKVSVKKEPNCSRSLSMVRRHFDLEFLVSRWGVESHTFIAVYGRFGGTLEDVVVLIMLAIYEENNAMGVTLGENDTRKLE